MPTVDALRLAQLHNHIDKMNHEVTTREKVCGYPWLSPTLEHLLKKKQKQKQKTENLFLNIPVLRTLRFFNRFLF